MDTFLPIACLLAGSATTLAILGLLVRRAVVQLQVADAYRDAARQLGLHVDTRGISVRGHLSDRRIWVGEVLEKLGSERRLEVRGVIGLDFPLGLGLSISRLPSRGKVLRRHRAHRLCTGNPTLDALFEIKADDPDLAAKVLSQNVIDALERLVSRWPEVIVTDTEVSVRLRHPETTADGLHTLIRTLVDTASALEEARRAISPPRKLAEDLPIWEQVATELGLRLDACIPALLGDFEGHRVRFVAHRGATGYSATLQLWFRAHPDLGILLRPQVEPDGYWSVGQDIQVGDPAFDAAFVIKGYDPNGVRTRLAPAVRAALLDLCAAGALTMDDRGLSLADLPPDAKLAGSLLNTAVHAALAMGW